MTGPIEICPDCKSRVPQSDGPTHAYLGASSGCWKLYGDILAKEYSDPRYMKAHRLTVDAYAAQHPGKPGRRESQSLVVHLVALCLLLERNMVSGDITRAMARLTEREIFDWLDPPDQLGSITVLDMLAAQTPEEHANMAREWGQSVWNAWAKKHRAEIEWYAKEYTE